MRTALCKARDALQTAGTTTPRAVLIECVAIGSFICLAIAAPLLLEPWL